MMLYNLIEMVQSTMARFADSGEMLRDGVSYYETPYELGAVYNTDQVPHIIYQEKGFTHYRSGKFIDKNQGFISVVTEGKINRFLMNELAGIPYNNLEDNQLLLERQDLILTQLGVIEDV